MLHALTRKFSLASDVDMDAIASQVPPQCTGADMYGLCADAWMHALRRVIADLTACGRIAADSDEAHDLENVDVDVCMGDFTAAAADMVPSLTEADLKKYDRLQSQYSTGKQHAEVEEDADAAEAPPHSGTNGCSNGVSNGGAAGPKGVRKLPPRKKKGGADAWRPQNADTIVAGENGGGGGEDESEDDGPPGLE